VENPATNEIIASVPCFDESAVEECVHRAKEAFPGWRKETLSKRRGILEAVADRLEKNREELATILVREVGKPLMEARHEVMSAERVFREFSRMDISGISGTLIRNEKNSSIHVIKKPIGVAGLILPWNYPLTVLSWKLAPALLTGNTVLVKPSPYTPLNTIRVGELMDPLLPEGVVNIVPGDDGTGEALLKSQGIGKIAFTGSVETGKNILRSASDSMKRVSLELGGNDPAIVLEDFDMKQLSSVFWSSFRNAGQICIAVKRLYVHEKLFDRFVEKYVTIAKRVKIGNGLSEGVQMGPVNNPEQLAIVEGLVEDAREKGGTIHTGGERIGMEKGVKKGRRIGSGKGGGIGSGKGGGIGSGKGGGKERGERGAGYFYPPTVITDVDESFRIVREEQFGPVIPIIPFTDADEAVERANSLRFGLGASVWTSNKSRGIRIAEELESGMAWVNTHMVVDPKAPFGGVKESGFGRELGQWGIDEYMDIQTIYVNK